MSRRQGMFTPIKEPQALAQFSDLSQFSEPKFLVCRGSPEEGPCNTMASICCYKSPGPFPKNPIVIYLDECMLGKGKYLGILRAIGHTIWVDIYIQKPGPLLKWGHIGSGNEQSPGQILTYSKSVGSKITPVASSPVPKYITWIDIHSNWDNPHFRSLV